MSVPWPGTAVPEGRGAGAVPKPPRLPAAALAVAALLGMAFARFAEVARSSDARWIPCVTRECGMGTMCTPICGLSQRL